MIKDTDQWTSSVREVSLLPGKPIRQQDGRWKIAERLNAWKVTGPRIFDNYLASFQKLAVKVLRERDPQFDYLKCADAKSVTAKHQSLLKVLRADAS